MRTLDKYLIREMIGPLLVGLGGFVLLLVGHMLWTMVEGIVEKQVPVTTVVRLALFHVPWAVTWALPVATLFACALAVNRLVGDGELSALRTGGLSLPRILAPTFAFGLGASIVCFTVDEFVVPWANTASANLARNIELGERAFALATRRFLKATPNDLVYALEATENGAEGLLAFHIVPDDLPWVTLADRATLRDGVLQIHEPTIYFVTPKGQFHLATAERIDIDVREAIAEYWSSRVGVEDMGLRELTRELRRLREQDARLLARYRVQMHWALALPLACLVFAVLGGTMTVRFGRGGSLTGALLALGVMCAYYLLKLWSDMLGNSGALPPAVAAWWQNVVFGGVGVWLLLRTR